jgi:hypothetical protein
MTTETEAQSAGDVTQEDRERACKHYGFDDEKDLVYWGNASKHWQVENLAKTLARHRIAATQRATSASDGYADAFYQIAKVLGIDAQPRSPREVFEQQMLPRLAALSASEAEAASLRFQLRQDQPYTAEEIELFQKCFDRGVLINDLIEHDGGKDETIRRARAILGEHDEPK